MNPTERPLPRRDWSEKVFGPYPVQLLYGIALVYAVVSYSITPKVVLLAMIYSFGIVFLLMHVVEWMLPAMAVAVATFRPPGGIENAKWGGPLVCICAAVSPIVIVNRSGNFGPEVAPWLSTLPSGFERAVPLIHDRLLLWGAIYFLAVVVAEARQLERRDAAKSERAGEKREEEK